VLSSTTISEPEVGSIAVRGCSALVPPRRCTLPATTARAISSWVTSPSSTPGRVSIAAISSSATPRSRRSPSAAAARRREAIRLTVAGRPARAATRASSSSWPIEATTTFAPSPMPARSPWAIDPQTVPRLRIRESAIGRAASWLIG
jgi:hypothetical protein